MKLKRYICTKEIRSSEAEQLRRAMFRQSAVEHAGTLALVERQLP